MPHEMLGVILQKMSLLDIYNLAKTQKGYWNNPDFWDEVRATHRHHIRDGKLAAQIVGYMQTHFSQILQDGGRSLSRNAELLRRVDEAYTPEFARGIRGGLMLLAQNVNGGMALLNQPGTIVTEGMQKALNAAAYRNELGFTDETGRAYLEARAAAGDTHAQVRLNDAARHGLLGFFVDEGRAYLERIVADVTNPGRQHAQEMLSAAFVNGMLGFAYSGRVYLERIVADVTNPGRQHAQEMLNEAAYFGKFEFSRETGRDYLEHIAGDVTNPGRQHAQERLNGAAYSGKLGFTRHRGTATSGYHYLVGRAALGDTDAQRMLNRGAEHCNRLGFTKDSGTATSGYHYLMGRAALGDTDAQKRLNRAAVKLGFDNEGRAYLDRIAGDVTNPGREHAQRMLNEAALSATLGFTGDRGTATSGYDYLVKRAVLGDICAQNGLNLVAQDGKLGFTRGTRLSYFFAIYNALVGVE